MMGNVRGIMKKLIFIAVAVLLVCGVSAGVVDSPYAKGVVAAESIESEVKSENEKKIAYISNLGELLYYTFDGLEDTNEFVYKYAEEYTLILTQDMDLETDDTWHKYAPDWQTRGWQARAIYADVEGGGHTISNFWCKPLDENGGGRIAALFSHLYGNVSNLNIVYDPTKTMPQLDNIWAYYGDYGGLAYEADDVSIKNVHIKNAKIISASSAGGVVGWPINCQIENCSFEGEINAVSAGGISENTRETNLVKNCLFKGKLSGFGIGGISSSHFLTSEDKARNIKTVYDSNIVILDELQHMDLGIYRYEFYPVGALIGFTSYWDLSYFDFKNNYVYISDNIVDEVRDISSLDETVDEGIIHIGGPTFDCKLDDFELTHLSFDTLGDADAYSNLDFVKSWDMDADEEHPVAKKNFISVINLSDEQFADNYKYSYESRYYGKHDVVNVNIVVGDNPDCQLTYLTVDGVDMLQSINEIDKLSLNMNESHIIVTKTSPLQSLIIKGLDGVDEFFLNNEKVEVVDGDCQIKYRLGDTLKLSFNKKSDYNVKVENSLLTELADNEFTFNVPLKSNLSLDDFIEINFDSIILESAPEDTNSTTIIIATVIPCVSVLIGLSIFLICLKKKHKTKNFSSK